MKIFYRQDGNIAMVVYERDLPPFSMARLTRPDLSMEISEPENIDLVIDVSNYGIAGKYFIDPASRDLYEDLNWQPEDPIAPPVQPLRTARKSRLGRLVTTNPPGKTRMDLLEDRIVELEKKIK